MSSRPKSRRIEDFDPNQSDPNDSDFEDAPASASRPRSRKSQKKKSSGRREQKQRRRPRYEGDSDIVDDDEEFSEEEFSESSGEDEDVIINPKTGRPARGVVVKQTVNYEESDAEEEPDFIEETGDEEPEVDELAISPKKTRNTRAQSTKPSQVVVLPFSNWKALGISSSTRTTPALPQTRVRSTRSRTTSKPPATMVGTRKSSRLSREPEQMVALSNSGRHAIPATPSGGSEDEDEPLSGRRTRGGKGLNTAATKKPANKQPVRKVPSAIMEASHEGTTDDAEEEVAEEIPHEVVDSVEFPHKDAAEEEIEPEEEEVAPAEEGATELAHGDSDESEGPVKPRGRTLRSAAKQSQPSPVKRKRAQDESSEFSPEDAAAAEEENMSDEDRGPASKRARRDSSSRTRNGGRKTRHSQRSRRVSDEESSDDEPDPDEVLMEAEDLERPRRQTRIRKPNDADIVFEARSTRRAAAKVDYRIPTMTEVFNADNEAALAADAEPITKRRRRDNDRRLFNIAGPFGGFNLPPSLLPGPHGPGDEIPLGGGDPDSSDDEGLPQQLKTPAPHDAAGGPANFGKLNKEKRGLADSDPLGVDENVKFDAVGGLDGHIDSLKEMVLHPLMYPEVIQKFGVQPPRGVLFHGPPGTGKTLLARALSNSIESGGKKVTFFMRKGADALSKWVGEAERQLRLLFEEAQKCQPSIIFFDEIDGLAPVRSSKTEQIHASIVATLLALMDGMDNRGQVVVIGATNRPDNVDPALRRPGRFDREFYFPLPDKLARRSIIDINTKGWEPPLPPGFKDQLAELTVGYGGADLRALCTEAALNAIQGTYPQIYKSNKKLAIDASKIKVLAKDFMISINKMIPSSARSNNSQVEPLAKSVEPLLRKPLERISKILDEILPRRRKLTALQEAEFDDRDDVAGFEKEALQRDIDRARVFRPRLLVRGLRGMGQQEIAAALLHKLEGLFVQSFDMATLLEDSSRSAEAAVVQLFKEVRRQKPSVIFIPDVDIWYDAVGHNVVKIFMQQLRSIPANDPVLLLGMMGTDRIEDKPDPEMLRDLFGFSSKSDFVLERPDHEARHEYFETLISLIRKRPSEFPDPENRKKRTLEVLEEVAEVPAITKANEKAQRKKQHKDDRHALNMLKIAIQPVLDQIKKKYKRFYQPQIPDRAYEYLFHDVDANTLTSDLTEEQRQVLQNRPYILGQDAHGVGGLKEVATGKFFYNLDLATIEERLAHGYYQRYKDFLNDLRSLHHDAVEGNADHTKILAAQELVNNVEVDMYNFEKTNPQLDQYLATMYAREKRRAKEAEEVKAKTGNGEGASNGAVILGKPPVPGQARTQFPPPITPIRMPGHLSNGDSSHAETNGTNGDVEMTDAPATNDDKASRAMPAPPQVHSQRSALEKMAPGSQVDDYHNSASTTTSGQNHSNRTSGATAPSHHTPAGFPPGYAHTAAAVAAGAIAGSANSAPAAGSASAGGVVNTEKNSSNGTDSRYFPNLDSAAILEGGSQIPDTQPNSDGQNSYPHTHSGGSTQLTNPQNIHALLNKGKEGDVPAEPKGKGKAGEVVEREVVGLGAVKRLHELLVERTSGMSVEQLGQVMSELTNEVVRLRAEWDKRFVVERLETVFEGVRRDIEMLQVLMEGSWE